MIPEIQRFEHHDPAMRFQDFGCLFHGFDNVCGLVFHILSQVEMSGNDSHPCGIHPFCHFDRFADFLKEFFPVFLLPGRE